MNSTRSYLINTKSVVIARNEVTKQSQIASDKIASTASRSRNDDRNGIYGMGSRNTTFKHNAFTLIELLLVVFIMAAAASAAVPNFTKFVQNAELNAAAQDLVSTIRFGQLRALSRGQWVRVKIEPSGYWLEVERFRDDISAGVSTQLVFERLKDRHGRRWGFPEGVILTPSEADVVLSPDGRIRSPGIELCRREKCFRIESGPVIGQVRVDQVNKGTADVRS